VSERDPKTTLPVESDQLSELARRSTRADSPRALGSEEIEARRTTEMRPDEIRGLISDAVPEIGEFAKQLPTQQGMRPVTKPPPLRAESAGDVVELAREDRKTQKARAREMREAQARAEAEARAQAQPRTDADAQPPPRTDADARAQSFQTGSRAPLTKAGVPTTTWVLLGVLVVVTTIAILGWLR
jgi:hypothetical protein